MIFLLDFELEVETFCEQPLTIEYQDEGKVRHYTPDFHAIKKGRNILMECKPEKFVQTAKNQRKFRAGQSWCATRGWIYQLVTDQDLYSGYHYICFGCRKSWQPCSLRQAFGYNKALCPHCSGPLDQFGPAFRPPRRRNRRAWHRLKTLIWPCPH